METFKLLSVLILLQVSGNVFCITTYYLSDHCDKTLDLIVPDQLRVKGRSHSTNDYGKECRVTVSSSLSSRIMVYFENLNIVDSTDCGKANVSLYDGRFYYRSNPDLIGKFCGSSTPTTIYESTDDYLTIGYQSSTSSSPDFDIIVTQFHEGYCYSWETECSNGKCIADDIACNGFNSCGDESDCRARTLAIIIGASVGGVAFVIILIAIGVCIYCAKRRTGNTGYVARGGVPVTTTMNSTNMTTSFGNQYNPPPGYNPNVYGMGTGVQSPPYPTSAPNTQQYPQPMAS